MAFHQIIIYESSIRISMSTKVSDVLPPINVESSLKAAKDVDLSTKAKAQIVNKSDKEYQVLKKSLQMKKWRDEDDLLTRWNEDKYGPLEEESGVYMWRGLIVLTQDMVPSILEAEWKDSGLPPSTGR
jgi:hypothetical protein